MEGGRQGMLRALLSDGVLSQQSCLGDGDCPPTPNTPPFHTVLHPNVGCWALGPEEAPGSHGGLGAATWGDLGQGQPWGWGAPGSHQVGTRGSHMIAACFSSCAYR